MKQYISYGSGGREEGGECECVGLAMIAGFEALSKGVRSGVMYIIFMALSPSYTLYFVSTSTVLLGALYKCLF